MERSRPDKEAMLCPRPPPPADLASGAERVRPARAGRRGQRWGDEEGRGQQAQAPTAALCPSTLAASAGGPRLGSRALQDLPGK